MPPKNDQSAPSKPPLTSPYPIAGKPWARRFPTPRIDDYIVSVRKDTRKGEFRMPEKGDTYDGIDQQKRLPKKFTFATAVPVEQLPGWVDLYYLAPFEEQESYNFIVEFPYVDKDYPRYTRTYIVLRTDDVAKNEPNADDFDPKFGRPFQLTDHKVERVADDPVLDSVFVRVTRIFERLPSPVIMSFKNNQYQQVVTIKSQEVSKSAPPPESALVEVAEQERTGTAKAKNVLATVPRVFPATALTTEIPSITRELWLGGFDEESQQSIVAGIAQQQAISPGKYSLTEKQITEFKKEITIRSIPFPQTRNHKELTREFFGGVVAEEIKVDSPSSSLDIEEGMLVVDSHFRNLEQFGKVRMTKKVDEWPIVFETETDPKLGIIIQMRKSIVPAGTIYPPGVLVGIDEKFVDIKAADKWRSIQIVSKVDPNSLPPDVSWQIVEHLNLPPIITSLGPAWHDAQSSEAAGDLHGVAVGVDGSASMHLKTHTRTKNRSTIARAFSTSSGRNHVSVGSNFEIATTHPIFGYCPATVTRMIRFGPPPDGLVTPIAFKPVSGMASVTERSFEEREVDGQDANSIQSATDLDMKSHAFGPVLVGTDDFGNSLSTTDKANTSEKIISDGTRQNTYQFSNGVLIYRHYYPNVDILGGESIESTSDNSIFSFRHTEINSPVITNKGVVSEVRILLPPSSPITLTTGQSVVVKVEVEVWRLNVYVVYVTSVIIP